MAQLASRPAEAAKLDPVLQEWRNRPIGRIRNLLLDATYVKVRHGGAIVDCAALVAAGVQADGKRTILGCSVALSESEVHWLGFLESLLSRGMHGIESITSDDHSGLRAALRAVMPAVLWPRCQVHLQRNAFAHVPKLKMRGRLARDIRAIFNAPDRAEADRLLPSPSSATARPRPAQSCSARAPGPWGGARRGMSGR